MPTVSLQASLPSEDLAMNDEDSLYEWLLDVGDLCVDGIPYNAWLEITHPPAFQNEEKADDNQ